MRQLIPTHWVSGEPIKVELRLAMALLRLAGCHDPLPLLGHKTVDGQEIVRCRLCNTEAWAGLKALDASGLAC